ncbi:hypothetical protein EV127DRAFT_513188 [Xylaria flabelliformis]|nr:hypothetical protein EV127DRAFT_513188 [Xylaria flabelliformis]
MLGCIYEQLFLRRNMSTDIKNPDGKDVSPREQLKGAKFTTDDIITINLVILRLDDEPVKRKVADPVDDPDADAGEDTEGDEGDSNIWGAVTTLAQGGFAAVGGTFVAYMGKAAVAALNFGEEAIPAILPKPVKASMAFIMKAFGVASVGIFNFGVVGTYGCFRLRRRLPEVTGQLDFYCMASIMRNFLKMHCFVQFVFLHAVPFHWTNQ